MATTKELILKLILDNKEMKDQLAALSKNVDSSMKSASKSTQGFNDSLKKVAKVLATGFIAKKIFDIGKTSLKTAGQFEQFNIAFKSMLGSQKKATKMMKDIKAFAATTPFELPEVVAGTKQLLAFGVAQEKVIPTMTTLGNIAAGLNVPVGRLGLVFGQVKAAGRLMGQDLLQFTNAGVPIIKLLANTMGIAENQVKGLVSEGKVGFAEMEAALESLGGKTGKWGNLMIEQSKTFNGVMSNISDAFVQTMLAIGDAMLPIAKIIALKLLDGLQKLQGWFTDNQDIIIVFFNNFFNGIKTGVKDVILLAQTLKMMLPFLALIATAWGLVLFQMKKAVMWEKMLAVLAKTRLAINTIIAAIQAVNPFAWLAIAIAGVIMLFKNWEALKTVMKNLWQIAKNIFKVFGNIGRIAKIIFYALTGQFDKVKTEFGKMKKELESQVVKIKTAVGGSGGSGGGGGSNTTNTTTNTTSSISNQLTNLGVQVTGLESMDELTKKLEEVQGAIEKIAASFTEGLVTGIMEGTLELNTLFEEFTLGIQEQFLTNLFEPITLGIKNLGMTITEVMSQTIGQLLMPISNFVSGAISAFSGMFKNFILQTLGFQKLFTTITILLGKAWTAMTSSMLWQWLAAIVGMIFAFLQAAAGMIFGFALIAASAAASAVSMIPIIGPILAPIAYIATFGLVIAGIAKLAGIGLAEGTPEVLGGSKTDTIPAMLTPGEMVVPKSMAEGVRSGDVQLGGDQGVTAGGGNVYNIIMDGANFYGEVSQEMAFDIGDQIALGIKNTLIAPFPT